MMWKVSDAVLRLINTGLNVGLLILLPWALFATWGDWEGYLWILGALILCGLSAKAGQPGIRIAQRLYEAGELRLASVNMVGTLVWIVPLNAAICWILWRVIA